MDSKQQTLDELEAVIKEYKLKPSVVGLAITGNRSFMSWMRDPTKAITSKTIDRCFEYVVEIRGQMRLSLDTETQNVGKEKE
jgi:hypothetical protein